MKSIKVLGGADQQTRTIEPAPSDDDGHLVARYRALCDAVYARRPVLREIVEKRGHKTLFDYAQDYLDVNLNETIIKRQPELLAAFYDEVALRLGEAVAGRATKQLAKYYFVSTADHHGPICHPFFLNSNLVTAMTCMEQGDELIRNIIVLACSNVSQNNSSFPRGLLFQTADADRKALLHRLAFLPAHSRLSPVFRFRGYTADDLKKLHQVVDREVGAGTVSTVVAEAVKKLLAEVYGAPEVLSSNQYADQVTLTNFRLWQNFFAPDAVRRPNLIYLEEEALVSRLLTKHHLNSTSLIGRLLFDQKFWPLVTKHFDGLEGAFSLAQRHGTYMFWALPKDAKYRVALWLEGDELVSADKTFRVPLTPEAISAGLADKTLIPSMLLCYLLLSFYYGLKCLGGFCQVNYLTAMKAAYQSLLSEVGDNTEALSLDRVQTKELGEDLTIAFLQTGKNQRALATGLDLVLYGSPDAWSILTRQAKTITIAEAIGPMMPEFYRVMYSESERKAALASITAEEIIALNGLSKKIEVCAVVQE